jgi:hypothetical protein
MPAPQPAGKPPPTPAYANAPAQEVAWSAVVGRSPAAQTYAAILDRRLRQELRHEQALAYSPSVAYSVRDQQVAHVLAVVDGLPDVHSLLVSAFIREIERLGEKDVSEDELRSAIDSLLPNADTSRGAIRWVTSAARNSIMGRPVRSVAAWTEDLAAMSVAQVREVGREALASSVFVLPQRSMPHRGFTRLSGCSDTAVAGHRIRSADSPLDPARLVVGADGISLVRGQAITTVLAAECAALAAVARRGAPGHRAPPVDQSANARGGLAAHGPAGLGDNWRHPGTCRADRAGHRGTPQRDHHRRAAGFRVDPRSGGRPVRPGAPADPCRAAEFPKVPSDPPPGRGLTRRREGGLAAFRVPVRAPYRFRKG